MIPPFFAYTSSRINSCTHLVGLNPQLHKSYIHDKLHYKILCSHAKVAACSLPSGGAGSGANGSQHLDQNASLRQIAVGITSFQAIPL